MNISESCSCGAEFEADDGGSTANALVYHLKHEQPKWQKSEVEAMAERWRSSHRHESPPAPASSAEPEALPESRS